MTRSPTEDRLQVWLTLRVSTRSLCSNDLSQMLGMPIGQVNTHLNFLEANGQIRRAEQSVAGATFWLGEPPSTPSEFRAALSARERLAAAKVPCDLATGPQRGSASQSSPVRPIRSGGHSFIVPQRDPLIAAFFGNSTHRAKALCATSQADQGWEG